MIGLIILYSLAGLWCFAFAALTLAVWRAPVVEDAGLSILDRQDGLDRPFNQQEWDQLDELQYRRATKEQL